MLQYVAPILGFGFLGLSFLMLFLGYRLLNSLVSQEKPSQNVVSLCKTFLWISLVFMISSGPLQWISLYVENATTPDSIILNIGMPDKVWEKTFGEIYIARGGISTPITNVFIKEKFVDNERVYIETHAVKAFIDNLRVQIQETDKIRIRIQRLDNFPRDNTYNPAVSGG